MPFSEYRESTFERVGRSSWQSVRISASRIRAVDDGLKPLSPYLAHHEVGPRSRFRRRIIYEPRLSELPFHQFRETERRYVRSSGGSDESVRYVVGTLGDEHRLVDRARRSLEQLDLSHEHDVSASVQSETVRAVEIVRQVPVIRIRVIGEGSGEHPLAWHVRASEILKRVSRYGVDQVPVMERPVRYEVRVGIQSYVEKFSGTAYVRNEVGSESVVFRKMSYHFSGKFSYVIPMVIDSSVVPVVRKRSRLPYAGDPFGSSEQISYSQRIVVYQRSVEIHFYSRYGRFAPRNLHEIPE